MSVAPQIRADSQDIYIRISAFSNLHTYFKHQIMVQSSLSSPGAVALVDYIIIAGTLIAGVYGEPHPLNPPLQGRGGSNKEG